MTCGFLIKQINDEMRHRVWHTLSNTDITTSQLKAMLCIHNSRNGVLSMKELERMLSVAQSTVAGLVTRLEEKGYVESGGDVRDRRVKLVALTEKGQCLCADARNRLGDYDDVLLASLGEDERKTLFSLLSKIKADFVG